MMSTDESFSFRVLDTLVNAPSSVAGIYADLVYLLGFDERGTIASLRQSLDQLEVRGWVLARTQSGATLKVAEEDDKTRCWARYAIWLPHAAREELAVDEIGLWYGITETGRDAWSAWATQAEEDPSPWQLDDDAVKCLVTVVAESEDIAERKLAEWLSRRGRLPTGSKNVASVAHLELRSGRVLPVGVRLTCSYSEPTPTDHE